MSSLSNIHTIAQKLSELAIRKGRLQQRSMESSREALERLLVESEEVVQAARRVGVPDLVATALMRQSEILICLKRYSQAIPLLREAKTTLGALRRTDIAVSILSKLADCHGNLQDWPATMDVAAKGIHQVESYRYMTTPQYMQSGYLRSRLNLYTWGVRSAYELGEFSAMLKYADLSKGRATLRYQMDNKSIDAKEIIRLETEFLKLNDQIDQMAARRDDARLLPLLAKRRTLWDQLSIHRYRNVTGSDLPEFHLGQIQSQLFSDEAIIYYYWINGQVLLIATIGQDALHAELRILTQKTRAKLTKYAENILSIQRPVGWLDGLSNYSSILLPQPKYVLNKKRLVFSPHRLLHAFPFHALEWKEGYIIQSFAVSYVPNLTTLLIRRDQTKHQGVFALGIRNFNVSGYKLNSLTYAEEEAQSIAELYQKEGIHAEYLPGKKAREPRVKQFARDSFKGFSCLHLTTHGENIPSDTPMESHIYLQDSILDGLEIANWRLNLDLVILSSCCSGQRSIKGRGLDELPGDELLGLQSAFSMAGCHRIVSALWPVEGTVAPKIMYSFHQFLIAGESADVALQLAINEFLVTADVGSRQIYYWGPFFLTVFGCSRADIETVS